MSCKMLLMIVSSLWNSSVFQRNNVPEDSAGYLSYRMATYKMESRYKVRMIFAAHQIATRDKVGTNS